MIGLRSESRRPRQAGTVAANRKGKAAASLVIVALLLGSGLVRIAGGTGAAIAREVSDLATSEPAVINALAPAACVSGPEIAVLIEELESRRGTLQERSNSIDLRESDLAAATALVESQLAALETAETELRNLISLAETAAEGDITQLTSVYENMKPKDAAAVFQQMAPQFAAGFLGRMRPESAARILAGLEPTTAYSVSAILAGRNASVPTE